MLLQAEVNKAKEEIKRAEAEYEEEKNEVQKHAALLTLREFPDLEKSLKIKSLDIQTENIAGIEVPSLENVEFFTTESASILLPIWFKDAVDLFRGLKKGYQKILIAEKKKEILEKELRIVSIRVNLFEKRLIPEVEADINKIRVFLGDQDLQAVAQAKVSKNKSILKKREREEALA